MMSYCRKSVNSFLLGHEQDIIINNNFCKAFHQTPCDQTDTGNFTGERQLSGEIGLLSCTESLGFESSDEISSFDDMGTFKKFSSCNSNSTQDDSFSSISSTTSSCSSSSSSITCYKNTRMTSLRRTEKKEFPPPLTSLNENGRRNFVLRPVRKDGRLEIIGVRIERPEILCASRQNGRLTLHLVSTVVPEYDDEDEDQDDEEETGDIETEDIETGESQTEEIETGEERESDETGELKTGEIETGEEREWKVPAGVRRCYQEVWGQQQHRFVTTM